MAAAFTDEPLECSEVYSWLLGDLALRAVGSRIVTQLQQSVGSCGAPDLCDRDQCVGPGPDIGILGCERAIYDDRADLDCQPSAEGHALTSIGGQIHEDSLDAFSFDVDVQWTAAVR